MVGAKSKKIANDGNTTALSSSESKNQSNSKRTKMTTKKNSDTLLETQKNNKPKVNQSERKALAVLKSVDNEKVLTSSNSSSKKITLKSSANKVNMMDTSKKNTSFVAKRTRSNKSKKLESVVSSSEPTQPSNSIETGSKVDEIKGRHKKNVRMNDKNISESKFNQKNEKEINVKSTAKPKNDRTESLTKDNKNPKNKTTVKQSEKQAESRNSSGPIVTENETVAMRPGTRKRRMLPCAENKDKQVNETSQDARKEKIRRLDSKDKLDIKRPNDKDLKEPAHNPENTRGVVTSKENSGSKTKVMADTSSTSSNDKIKETSSVLNSKVEEVQKQKVALKKVDIAQLLENDDDEYR